MEANRAFWRSLELRVVEKRKVALMASAKIRLLSCAQANPRERLRAIAPSKDFLPMLMG
jgi:hypothetical protein